MDDGGGTAGAVQAASAPPVAGTDAGSDARDERGFGAQWRKLRADVREDYRVIVEAEAKYRGPGAPARPAPLVVAAIQKIGLQMMVYYRVMRFLRGVGLTTLAKVASRRIRRVYGAEIHWDTQLAPGVMIVHGTGLVLSRSARVGPRCILFQHVTLGESVDPESRDVGAPTLEADVHVGPGATLLGPITIGRGTKITASALVMESVPPMSLVVTPAPVVRPRGTSRG